MGDYLIAKKIAQKIGLTFLGLAFLFTSNVSVSAADESQNQTILQFNDKYKDKLWGAERIQAVPLWSVTRGSNVVVAVVDTGVNYNHEDLEKNIWINTDEVASNGIDDDGNGFIDDVRGWDFFNGDNDPMDDNGHGTSVAGVIAAQGNNSKGIIGVAMDAKIMALKCMGADKSGDTTKAVWAIKYAADNGADVINISWSARISTSDDLDKAINYAVFKGVTVIVASGNHYDNVSDFYPANNAQVVTVGATDKDNQRAKFSNWGAKMDVVAPGVDIKTANISGYKDVDGTSVATGYVSGLTALLLHYAPSLDNQEVKTILRNSASDLGDAGWDEKYGAGLVNGVNMLRYASTNYSNRLEKNFSSEISDIVFAESFPGIKIAAASQDQQSSKKKNGSSKYQKLYEKYKKYKVYKNVYWEVKTLKATNPAAYYKAEASGSGAYKAYKNYQKYKTYKAKAKK